jgi:hypothetical protein
VLLKESSIVSWASIVTFDYRCIIALQDASQATTTLANGKLVYVFEANHARSNSKKTMPKTYNSGYSLVVTHLTTNPPVRCLNRAERTGSLVFNVLWSYVECSFVCTIHIAEKWPVGGSINQVCPSDGPIM